MSSVNNAEKPKQSERILEKEIGGSVFTLPSGTKIILHNEACALNDKAVNDMLQRMANGDWGDVMQFSAEYFTAAMQDKKDRAIQQVVFGVYHLSEYKFVVYKHAENYEFTDTIHIKYGGESFPDDPKQIETIRAERKERMFRLYIGQLNATTK